MTTRAARQRRKTSARMRSQRIHALVRAWQAKVTGGATEGGDSERERSPVYAHELEACEVDASEASHAASKHSMRWGDDCAADACGDDVCDVEMEWGNAESTPYAVSDCMQIDVHAEEPTDGSGDGATPLVLFGDDFIERASTHEPAGGCAKRCSLSTRCARAAAATSTRSHQPRSTQ